MAKSKPSRKRKIEPSKPATLKRKSGKTRAARQVKLPKQPAYTEEYREYLECYETAGVGRPRLSPKEFDLFDDELLDLLALQAEEVGLDDEQLIRLQELEYLLLHSES